MTLVISDLVAGYSREVPILRGVNLTAEAGRVTAIIGPNGAGKSTLFKTVYGYLRPTSGAIVHDQSSLVGLEPKDMLARGMAYLLQGHSVFPNMTVSAKSITPVTAARAPGVLLTARKASPGRKSALLGMQAQ